MVRNVSKDRRLALDCLRREQRSSPSPCRSRRLVLAVLAGHPPGFPVLSAVSLAGRPVAAGPSPAVGRWMSLENWQPIRDPAKVAGQSATKNPRHLPRVIDDLTRTDA